MLIQLIHKTINVFYLNVWFALMASYLMLHRFFDAVPVGSNFIGLYFDFFGELSIYQKLVRFIVRWRKTLLMD